MKNPAAVALGKLAKGRPKKYSKEELAKRTARLPHRSLGKASEHHAKLAKGYRREKITPNEEKFPGVNIPTTE